MDPEFRAQLGLDVNDHAASLAIEDAEEFANLIESFVELRKTLGLSQNEVARRAECSQSAVSDFERIGGNPTISTIQRFARALGASVPLRLRISDISTWRAASDHLPTSTWSAAPPSVVLERPPGQVLVA